MYSSSCAWRKFPPGIYVLNIPAARYQRQGVLVSPNGMFTLPSPIRLKSTMVHTWSRSMSTEHLSAISLKKMWPPRPSSAVTLEVDEGYIVEIWVRTLTTHPELDQRWKWILTGLATGLVRNWCGDYCASSCCTPPNRWFPRISRRRLPLFSRKRLVSVHSFCFAKFRPVTNRRRPLYYTPSMPSWAILPITPVVMNKYRPTK